MDLETLIIALPSSSPNDIQEWLQDFQKSHPEDGQEAFLAHLRHQGLITDLEYWDAINGAELSLIMGATFADGDMAAEYDFGAEGNMELGDLGIALTESAEAADNYEFIEILGKGAMGEVHIVRETKLKRKVALKFIKEDKCNDQSKARFLREAWITAQLDHPNILPVYAFEENFQGNYAYSMKWIKGRTLENIFDDRRREIDQGIDVGGLKLLTRLNLFLKLCDAMEYSHARHVIHRDLKPANIMIGPYGELYVMDWGIARVVGKNSESNHMVENLNVEELDLDGDGFDTQDGAIVGTIAYLSPEQARGAIDELTVASDQFALGLILFETISLNKGIQKGNVRDMLRRAQRGQVAPAVHYDPSQQIHPALEAIVERATAFLPEKRYPSVKELAEDIRRFLRDEPVSVYQDPPQAVVMRWVSKHRIKAFMMVSGLIILGLGSSIYSLSQQQQIREEHILKQRLLQESLQVRNKRLGRLLSDVGNQSNIIAQELLHYKGLLRQLGTAAQSRLVLQPNVAQVQVYDYTDFNDPAKAPTDLALSSRYGIPLSTEAMVLKMAPNIELSPRIMQIRQELASLTPVFQNIFQSSLNADGATFEQMDKAVREEGLSMVWAFVGSAAGIHASYPGKGTYDDEYDPRQRPWYKDSLTYTAPTCLPPYEDKSGQGKILPCTQVIRTDAGQVLGVAGIELSVVNFAKKMVKFKSNLMSVSDEQPRPIGDVTGAVLLQGDGRILALHNIDQELNSQFNETAVLKELQAGGSGYHINTERRELYVYNPVGDSGWYYVMFGKVDDLLPPISHYN